MTGSDSSNENTNPNQTSNGAQTDSENPSQEDAPNVATPTPSVTQEPEESMVFDDIKQNDKNPVTVEMQTAHPKDGYGL